MSVDGRRGRIRKQGGRILVHTVLNVLLQMTGSLCMKWGLVHAVEWMREAKVAVDELGNPKLLANVHDEVQMEVLEDEVQWMTYEIEDSKDAWKAEEKRQHVDDLGIWSALREGRRPGWRPPATAPAFHPAGDILCRAFAEAGETLGIRCSWPASTRRRALGKTHQ